MTRDWSEFRCLCHKSAAFLAALFLCATASLAQDITITSRIGALTFDGRLLGYDGEYIRIDTEHGVLTLDYRKVACTGAACPNPDNHVERIRFAGTPRIGDLILPALIEGYARAHALRGDRREDGAGRFVYELSERGGGSGVRLEFHLTTTEAGLSALQVGTADIAMAARDLRPEDVANGPAGAATGLSETRHIRLLAYDAAVPVVSPMADVRGLSLTDLARIYAGEVTNWSELGGPDAEIVRHLGDPQSGLSRFFVERVLGDSGRDLTSAVRLHASDRQIVSAVMTDPHAIGIVSFERSGNAVPLPLTGACGLLDIATLDTVKTGDYPLTFPLYLYLPTWRLGPFGRDFMDWLSSAEAQRILRRIGVPGQAAAPIPVGQQGDRIVSAIQRAGDELGLGPLLALADLIEGRERLAPTFRFEPGQSRLDPTSRARIRALAHAIAEGRYRGHELLLAGFSDGVGSANRNLALSEARAEAVRAAIVDALGGALPEGQILDVVALGEVMPVSCDDTLWGRDANRRVELWSGAAG